MVHDQDTHERLVHLEMMAENTAHSLQLIDKRFDLVEQRFVNVDKRFDGMDKRMEILEGKFDRWLMWIIGLALANLTSTAILVFKH